MKLPWLKSAVERSGPFTTIYLDTTRIEPNAAAEIETRWSSLRSSLAAEGAPDALLAEIEDTLLEPSSLGGRHGRAIIATDQQILVDRVLPVPPLLESAHRGDFPQLLPLLQLTPFAVSQLLIVVDRAGADLHLRAPENPSIVHAPNDLGEDATIEGGHDELHKASVGGGSQHGWRANNFEARVEDSWERNADTVAATVERIPRERDPDMVMLSGDVRAMALFKDALGRETRERLIEVQGGNPRRGARTGLVPRGDRPRHRGVHRCTTAGALRPVPREPGTRRRLRGRRRRGRPGARARSGGRAALSCPATSRTTSRRCCVTRC